MMRVQTDCVWKSVKPVERDICTMQRAQYGNIPSPNKRTENGIFCAPERNGSLDQVIPLWSRNLLQQGTPLCLRWR